MNSVTGCGTWQPFDMCDLKLNEEFLGTYILVITEYLTGWCKAVALPSAVTNMVTNECPSTIGDFSSQMPSPNSFK